MRNRFRRAILVVAAGLGLAAAGAASAQNQRSAQSDCQREAARRGYVVLGTRNFQQHKDGWSLDLQARDASGRVTWGSCFVETKSGDVSLYGFGWGGGGGSGGGNAFQFTCASVDHQDRECQLPVNGRARLVKRKSDAPCIEGKSWGQRGDRVWVDNGCRALFEVTAGGGWGGGSGGGSGGGNPGQQQRAEVQCRNQAMREGISVRYVEPARQQGSYWETTVDGTQGGQRVRPICRFFPAANRADLYYSGGGSGGGWPGWGGSGNSGQAVAESACLREAQRQGLRVVEQNAAQPISGGYGMRLKVRRGNGSTTSAYCRYWSNSGKVQIDD